MASTIRPFTESLPMALLQARESAMRLFRPMLAEHELTEQQWRVLRSLAAYDGPLEVAAIADATFLLGSSLSRILSNLEGRSFVSRSRVADDQRRSAISLTPSGHRLVATVAPHSERIYDEIEQAFGSSQLGELIQQLNHLRDTVSNA